MGLGSSICGHSTMPVQPGAPPELLNLHEAGENSPSSAATAGGNSRQTLEPLKIKVPKPIVTPIMVTPRREKELLASMCCTPKGENAHLFPYYCPLCMEFFKDILRSNCCGNYTCVQCCKGFLSSNGIEVCCLSYFEYATT